MPIWKSTALALDTTCIAVFLLSLGALALKCKVIWGKNTSIPVIQYACSDDGGGGGTIRSSATFVSKTCLAPCHLGQPSQARFFRNWSPGGVFVFQRVSQEPWVMACKERNIISFYCVDLQIFACSAHCHGTLRNLHF